MATTAARFYPVLFTGTVHRVLDAKKRLALPRRVRAHLGNPQRLFLLPWPDGYLAKLEQGAGVSLALLLTPGPDGCLWVYAPDDLERLAERLDQEPAAGPEARVFRKLYFAQAEAVDLDRKGRILVPERLAQFAGLQHDVVLIGVRDHLELWDAGRWQYYLTDNAPRFDAVAEGAFKT